MRVTAAMITKNEERCIARCLNSFKRICDEIIIGDTGSTDRTVEIARSLGATVFDVPWEDSFSKARNAVLKRCRGDWVILFDADEFLRPGDDLRLKGFMRTYLRDREINALLIEKWEYEQNQYSIEELYALSPEQAAMPQYDLFPHHDLRVARLLPDARYVLPIHETLVHIDPKTRQPKDALFGYRVPNTECVLLHDGYSGVVRHDKNLRNLMLLEKEIEQGERYASLFFYAAQSSSNVGDMEKKIRYLKEFVTFDTPVKVYGMTGHIMYIDELYKAHATFGEVRQVIEMTERIYPGHPTSAQLWSEYYSRLGSPQRALEALLDAERKRETYPWDGFELESDSRRKLFYLAQYSIAELYAAKGERNRAMEYYAKSYDENSDHHASLGKYLLASLSRPADEVLNRLIGWHHPKQQDKAQIVLRMLRQNRPDTVFLGYFEKSYTGEQDINFIVMMALVGEGQQAVKKLLERHNLSGSPYSLYLQMAAAVAKLFDCTSLLYGLSPNAGVLLTGDGTLDSHWTVQDREFCLAVAQQMLVLGGWRSETQQFFEELATAGGLEMRHSLAVLMMERYMHREALGYQRQIQAELQKEGSDEMIWHSALDAGRCAYLTGDYAEALALFREVLARGGNKDALEDYCLWMAERSPEVAGEARALAEKVHIVDDPARHT